MDGFAITGEGAPCSAIDLVERLADARDWAWERRSDAELAARLAGCWCDLQLWFAWRPDAGALCITCGLDMRVPRTNRGAVYPLLAGINERLWIGHFELWSEDGWPTFRHTLIGGGEPLGLAALEEVVDAGRRECDRYYPAFQFVLWGGEDAEGAIAAALVDPKGNA